MCRELRMWGDMYIRAAIAGIIIGLFLVLWLAAWNECKNARLRCAFDDKMNNDHQKPPR